MSSSPSLRTQLSQSNGNNSIEIEKLFDINRIPQQWNLIPLIVYIPFGLCLCVIRVFIGLHAFLIATLLPKASSIRCFILRTMCAIIGIIVKEIDTPPLKSKSSTKVIVSNHITNFDHIAIDLVLPCVVPGVWSLPKYLNWGLGFHDFGIENGRAVLIENVKRHINCTDQSLPILAHPEGATTNGRVGLLKFSSWPFSLDMPIQLVFLSITRAPPMRVTPSVLGSRWWSDLFWVLFVPFTIFNIRYLSVEKRSENESIDDFTKRVQKTMARVMCITATNFTDAEKVELVKRLSHESSQQVLSSPNQRSGIVIPTASVSGISPQLEIMSRKVKEVLPQVPIDAIHMDLKVTKNIDDTITRILDGTVSFTPEQITDSKSQSISNTSASESASSNSRNMLTVNESVLNFNTGAKTFGKNANERMKSYHERKALLIENARLIYMKRKGINSNDYHKI